MKKALVAILVVISIVSCILFVFSLLGVRFFVDGWVDAYINVIIAAFSAALAYLITAADDIFHV